MFYQVLDPQRRVVAGDPSLQVAVPWEGIKRGPVLLSAVVQEQRVRVAIVGRHVMPQDPQGWAAIVLAETQIARGTLAQSLATKALWIIGLMGVITIGAAMVAAQRALKPLHDVARAIGARDATSRDPLVVEAPPEAEVLVQTINDFIARLNARIALMRRVMGDVAHQIRTPLAAIASQVELWEYAPDEATRRVQAQRIKTRLEDVGELSSQMLSHALVLHRSQGVSMDRVDLVDLVRQQLMQQLEDRPARQVDVEFTAPDQPVWTCGDAVMLKEAVRNVLGNALTYGVRTRLCVAVKSTASHAEICVEDDGPGIEPTRWDALRRPFTPRGDGRIGASLGLSIVDEVMRAHGGELGFETPASGGFRVVLRLALGPQPMGA